MSCACEPVDGVPLEDFLPYVLPSVVGLPPEIAAHNIRMAAVAFVRQTQYLERTLFLDRQCGVVDYHLEVPDCYSIMSVSEVRVDGSPWRAERRLPARGGSWFTFDKPDWLRLGCNPGDDLLKGIEVRVNVLPGQDSCELDRILYDQYADALQHGALENIYRMKSAPWYDPQLSMTHARLFRAAMSEAAGFAMKRHVSGPLVVKVRRFV